MRKAKLDKDNEEKTSAGPGQRFPPLAPELRPFTIVLIFVLVVIVTLLIWYLKSRLSKIASMRDRRSWSSCGDCPNPRVDILRKKHTHSVNDNRHRASYFLRRRYSVDLEVFRCDM